MDHPEHHCESCGAVLPGRFRTARMVTCEHCGTTAVLKDDAFRAAGTGGEVLEAPSLVRLGEEVSVAGRVLMPVGLAQFDYGRGWWDEYWCLDGEGAGWWLSADEGDYALERALDRADWPRGFRPRLGTPTQLRGLSFTVAEVETATCRAVRGEFPEEIGVGEAHLYADLAGPDGEIATHERWDGGEGWSLGFWVDPWEVVRP